MLLSILYLYYHKRINRVEDYVASIGSSITRARYNFYLSLDFVTLPYVTIRHVTSQKSNTLLLS